MEGNENRGTPVNRPAGEGKVRKILLLLRRILAVILTVLLIATAVIVVVYRDRLNLDSIKRYLTYQALERNEDGVGVEFDITSEKNSSYAALEDCLIICSGNRLLVYSDGGSLYADMEVSINHPVLVTEGEYALVYDAGGQELYLFSQRQLIHEYTAHPDNAIIAARVNENGWLAVVEESAGYKASATVYNDSYQPVITENISSNFVMDAAISPDNRHLALVTIGQQDTTFAASIRIYEFTQGAEEVAAVVSDTPALDLHWDHDGFWYQEQHGVRRVTNQGQLIGKWEDETLHLRGFSLNGDDFAVEYFSRYRSGNVGTINVVDDRGRVSATMNLNDEIISVTAAGRYIGVLTHSDFTIYTSDLYEYATLEHEGDIVEALVRSDGTAMLVYESSASVFLP